MAPNTVTTTATQECPATVPDLIEIKQPPYKLEIVWRNVFLFIYLHGAAVYGLYLMLFKCMWPTFFWAISLYVWSGLGITAGAHRLWSHRSYKAKLPLRIFLAIGNTISFQNDILDWSRDHRVHHKHTDSNADPYNISRGFFFSHMGWLMCKKHPDVKEKGRRLDLSDLYADPVVMFQRKYYLILMPLACFILPTIIPMYYWGETFSNGWFVAALFRYTFTLHVTWLVNSIAHMWGYKPYDKAITSAENWGVALGALGEGWHNYHHVFPWDYKTAELGNYSLNYTKAFLDFMAYIGQAYDLKTVPKEVIYKRAIRTGDGSHEQSNVWGWGDQDICAEDVKDAAIENRSNTDEKDD